MSRDQISLDEDLFYSTKFEKKLSPLIAFGSNRFNLDIYQCITFLNEGKIQLHLLRPYINAMYGMPKKLQKKDE